LKIEMTVYKQNTTVQSEHPGVVHLLSDGEPSLSEEGERERVITQFYVHSLSQTTSQTLSTSWL